MEKICHLTSVHPWYDVRIFHKECFTLVKAGYEVHLIAAGVANEVIKGIHTHGVTKRTGSRLLRMTMTVYAVYKMARSVDADIYHLHDPELLPVGLLLKRAGKIVIYDAHEDVPRQILSKPWINPLIRKSLSWLFELFEDAVSRRLDGVLTATPHIDLRFKKVGCNSLAINNFPKMEEFAQIECDWQNKDRAVCYVGAISVIRGIYEMVTAISLTDVKLLLAGAYSPIKLKNKISILSGWNSVIDFGYVDRSGISNVMDRSCAGMVILHPTINYIDSLPIKLFEYMASGIPVIASNFLSWQQIIEDNDCGICVDPLDPKAIASAIDYFVQNPDVARRMGENGRQAVSLKYNWEIEEKKLLNFYSIICSRSKITTNK